MGHCSLCGDDAVFMLFRAQWALILGEGLGRKGKKVPSDPCSASKPTLSRKDQNPPHGTARFPQIGRHRENESLLRPPYITVSSTRTFGPSRKRALPKLSRLSPHPDEGCVCPLGGIGALFFLHEGDTLDSGGGGGGKGQPQPFLAK